MIHIKGNVIFKNFIVIIYDITIQALIQTKPLPFNPGTSDGVHGLMKEYEYIMVNFLKNCNIMICNIHMQASW